MRPVGLSCCSSSSSSGSGGGDFGEFVRLALKICVSFDEEGDLNFETESPFAEVPFKLEAAAADLHWRVARWVMAESIKTVKGRSYRGGESEKAWQLTVKTLVERLPKEVKEYMKEEQRLLQGGWRLQGSSRTTMGNSIMCRFWTRFFQNHQDSLVAGELAQALGEASAAFTEVREKDSNKLLTDSAFQEKMLRFLDQVFQTEVLDPLQATLQSEDSETPVVAIQSNSIKLAVLSHFASYLNTATAQGQPPLVDSPHLYGADQWLMYPLEKFGPFQILNYLQKVATVFDHKEPLFHHIKAISQNPLFQRLQAAASDLNAAQNISNSAFIGILRKKLTDMFQTASQPTLKEPLADRESRPTSEETASFLSSSCPPPETFSSLSSSSRQKNSSLSSSCPTLQTVSWLHSSLPTSETAGTRQTPFYHTFENLQEYDNLLAFFQELNRECSREGDRIRKMIETSRNVFNLTGLTPPLPADNPSDVDNSEVQKLFPTIDRISVSYPSEMPPITTPQIILSSPKCARYRAALARAAHVDSLRKPDRSSSTVSDRQFTSNIRCPKINRQLSLKGPLSRKVEAKRLSFVNDQSDGSNSVFY